MDYNVGTETSSKGSESGISLRKMWTMAMTQ